MDFKYDLYIFLYFLNSSKNITIKILIYIIANLKILQSFCSAPQWLNSCMQFLFSYTFCICIRSFYCHIFLPINEWNKLASFLCHSKPDQNTFTIGSTETIYFCYAVVNIRSRPSVSFSLNCHLHATMKFRFPSRLVRIDTGEVPLYVRQSDERWNLATVR